MRCHLLFLAATLPALLAAQVSHPGFRTTAVAGEVALEARLMAGVDTDTIRRQMHLLAGEAHVAGTPAQVRTADHVLREMVRWGLDTSRASYQVFLPFHDSTVVEVIGTSRTRLSLTEPMLGHLPHPRPHSGFRSLCSLCHCKSL